MYCLGRRAPLTPEEITSNCTLQTDKVNFSCQRVWDLFGQLRQRLPWRLEGVNKRQQVFAGCQKPSDSQGGSQEFLPSHQSTVGSLLSVRKAAVTVVDNSPIQTEFYSILFKKNGKMRPLINVKTLNQYLISAWPLSRIYWGRETGW